MQQLFKSILNAREYIRHNRSAFFFAFVFFIIFPFLYSAQTTDPELHLRYFALSIVMLFAGIYFFFRAGKKEIALFFSFDKSFFCFLLFFLWSTASIIKSLNPGDGFYELSKIFLLLCCFAFLIYSLKKSEKAIEIYTFAINLAVILFSVISCLQFMPVLKSAITGVKASNQVFWFTSTFANKNFYAEAIFLCIPFALYGSFIFKNRLRILCLVSIAMSFITIVIAGSVAVWIAFAISTMVFIFNFILFRKKTGLSFHLQKKIIIKIIFGLTGIVVAVILIFNISMFKRFFKPLSNKMESTVYYLRHGDEIFKNSQINANSLYERLLLIRNSVKLFKENPVTGCGTGNWKIYFPKFGVTGTGYLNQGRLRFEHPHNDYLLVLCEGGIIGLMLWLGFFFMFFKSAYQIIKPNAANSGPFLMLLLISGMSGFMVISFFSYPKERFYSILLLLVMMAIPASSNPGLLIPKFIYSKLLLTVLIIICFASVYINYKRLHGEFYMKRAIYQQKLGNMLAMRYNVLKAKNYFYPLDLTSTPLNWFLGFSGFYAGENEKAFDYYTHALAENPYHVQVLNDLGTLYEKKGNRIEAIELYNRALFISPLNSLTILNLAAAYYNEGELEKALMCIRNYPDGKEKAYKKELQAILLAQANQYVQLKKDTLLADYLSGKIGANENYLIELYEASGRTKVPYENISNALNQKK